jgi:hypothetical protein
MRPVETSPGMGGGVKNDGGVNSTMIHCKHFCKCHNVPPVQQYNKKTDWQCQLLTQNTLAFDGPLLYVNVHHVVLHSSRRNPQRGAEEFQAVNEEIVLLVLDMSLASCVTFHLSLSPPCTSV